MTAVLLSSICASGSVFLFALWYVRSKGELEARIRMLGDQQRVATAASGSFSQRVALPVVDSVARTVMNLLPTSMIARASKWLVIAGEKYTPSQFFTVVLITSTLLPGAYLALLWSSVGSSASALAVFFAVPLAAMGIITPFMMLRRAALNRQKAIWRAMPNALDLMVTCVEAGLSLDFALQRVAERYRGPLSDEIHRTLREVALGKTRREALKDMAERVAVPDLMTFVNSIVQAETLGTSVGNVLRVQATQMRTRRRQRAEQIARQAPVKMVFPTVFLLMPSLFMVTIGPMALYALDTIRNGP